MMSHSLAATPTRGDRILAALENATRDWKTSSVEIFDMDVVIAHAQESLPVLDTDGGHIGFDRYRFFSWGQADKVLRVRLKPDDEVLICIDNDWVTVPAALESFNWPLPTVGLPMYQERRIARQRQWWVENRKKFDFLSLPAEIRTIIYQFAFGFRVVPYFPDHRFGRYRQISAFQSGRSISLLHVSRLVYKEARHVLYRDAIFTTQHLAVARRLLTTRFPRNNIHRLELRLEHEDWFRLFGAKPTEDGEIPKPASCTWALRSMQLDQVKLYVGQPSTKPQGLRRWLDSQTTCQRVVVDWIFEAIWQVVRGLPITITGYVKIKQKIAFEAACEIERHRFLLWRDMMEATGQVERVSLADWDEDVERITGAEEAQGAKGGQPEKQDRAMKEDQVSEATEDIEEMRHQYMEPISNRRASQGVDVWKPGSSVVLRETPVCVHGDKCSLVHWSDID